LSSRCQKSDSGNAGEGRFRQSGWATLPTMGPSPLTADRFRSSLCLAGKHEECEHSALMGICGCECHDWLDELEDFYVEEMN
jgi:hypothetical protein